MTRIGGRPLVALLAACGGLALLGATAPAIASVTSVDAVAAPAAAPGSGACPTTSDGVTVVVDFNGLGGRQVEVSCAPGAPTTGYKALQGVPYVLTPVTRDTNFLCRIDGQPSTANCSNYQPFSAYWAYWTAPRGGTWTYSSEGAGTRRPQVGQVEGWSFVSVSKEDDAPPPDVPPPAKPTPPTTTTAPSTGGPGPVPEPDPTTTTARSGGGRSTTTTAAPTGDTTTSSAVETTTSSPSTTLGDESASATIVDRDDDGSGAGGIVIGAGVVLVLGGLIAATVLRRRASEPLEPLP